LWDGLVRLAMWVLIASIASFALDASLALPVGVRGLFIVAGSIAFIVLAARRLVAPVAHRMSDEELAVLIEERHPDLHQSLITAIQLSRADSFGGRWTSNELLASVVQEVEAKAASIEPRRVFGMAALKRNLIVLAVAASVVVGGAVLRSDLFGIWLRRNVLLSADRWPKGTHLELEPTTPLVVATGDSLPLAVRIVRGRPSSVVVEWEFGDDAPRADAMNVHEGASWDVLVDDLPDSVERTVVTSSLAAYGQTEPDAERSLDKGAGRIARGLRAPQAEELARTLRALGVGVRTRSYDLCVHEFRNVSRPFRFYVVGGDDRIGPFDVDVRLRPRIDMQSIEIRYRFPYYTGQDDSERVQQHGNLKVPTGTRVRFDMSANIDIDAAWLVLRRHDDDEAATRGPSVDTGIAAGKPWPAAGAVQLELREGRHFSGEFTVDASGHYYFQFQGRSGFRSEQPQRFRIQAIEDRKPIVRILEPARMTEDVTPQADVPIAVHVEDDFGVRRAVIEGTYFAPGSDTPVRMSIPLPELDAATPREAQGKPPEVRYVLGIPDIATGGAPPAPGARFEFFALAEDFGVTGHRLPEATGGGEREVGHIGESQVHLLEIVDPEELEQTLVDQTMVIRDIVRQLQVRQETVRRELESFQDRATIQGKISADEGQKLSRHRQDQGRIGDGVQRQVDEIEQLLTKMAENKVGDDDWKEWLGGVQDQLRDLAENRSPQVVSDLDAVRRDAGQSPQDPTRLAPIGSRQLRIEQELDAIVSTLTHYGDINAVIQQLRDLRAKQQAIRDATRNAAGTGTSKEAGP